MWHAQIHEGAVATGRVTNISALARKHRSYGGAGPQEQGRGSPSRRQSRVSTSYSYRCRESPGQGCSSACRETGWSPQLPFAAWGQQGDTPPHTSVLQPRQFPQLGHIPYPAGKVRLSSDWAQRRSPGSRTLGPPPRTPGGLCMKQWVSHWGCRATPTMVATLPSAPRPREGTGPCQLHSS